MTTLPYTIVAGDTSNSDKIQADFEALLTGLNTISTVPVKTTGSAIDTGTNDTDFVTPKAITDSNLMSYLDSRFKIGTFTKNQTITGDISYTSIGFSPKAIIFLQKPDLINNTTLSSFGFGDGTSNFEIHIRKDGNNSGSAVIFTGDGVTWDFSAVIKTLDADGFTLTYSKTGSPPAGTITVYYMALR